LFFVVTETNIFQDLFVVLDFELQIQTYAVFNELITVMNYLGMAQPIIFHHVAQ